VNPRAEVPALVDDDGVAVYDSTVICEYLEDRYAQPPLYPADARARAKCRLVEDIADTQLDAALYAVTVVEFGRGETHTQMHDAAARDVERLYGVLGDLLANAQFFCGGFSIADIALIPHFLVATFLGFAPDPARHAPLMRWLDAVQTRPSVMRDNADVLETLQRLQAEQRSAFDPYRVQWRSDRLEWVIKNGFAEWFMKEMHLGRAFFPLPIRAES
jgi:glutathione S-transferase/RNA polymerase-associated protein